MESEDDTVKLIGIVGTNSAESTNRKLLQYMQSHLADKAEIELVEVKVYSKGIISRYPGFQQAG